jgi:hypothetical protein
MSKPENQNMRVLTDEEIALNWATDTARHLVRGGYTSLEDIFYFVKSVVEDEGFDASPQELINTEIKQLKEEQTSWSGPTEFDRFSDVFESLFDEGIIALENLSCCQSCAIDELIEITESAEKKDPASLEGTIGYTFFHEQDTETAVDGGGIWLSYGSFPLQENDPAAIQVGKSVSKKLIEAGFNVHWDEDIKTRIHVPLKWQRKWVG